MKLTKVAIHFPSHAYAEGVSSTIVSYLKYIGSQELDSYKFDEGKEKFVRLYNMTIFSFYLLCQNKLLFGDNEAFHALVKQYLYIEAANVFFNEEVDKLLKNTGDSQFNGFILDGVQNPPYVYAFKA